MGVGIFMNSTIAVGTWNWEVGIASFWWCNETIQNLLVLKQNLQLVTPVLTLPIQLVGQQGNPCHT